MSNSKAEHLVCVLSEMSVLSCYTFKTDRGIFTAPLGSGNCRFSGAHCILTTRGIPWSSLQESQAGRAVRPFARGSGGAPAIALPTAWAQSYVLGSRQNGRGRSERAAMGTRRRPGARACPREWVAEREQRSERWPRRMIRSHWWQHREWREKG